MKLTKEEQAFLDETLKEYLDHELVLKMNDFIQHGCVTTLNHCENVARFSLWLNRRLHLNADEKALLVGALLHDFYLYDWHEPDPSHRFHGFSHARKACDNAVLVFHITKKEQMIIISHMWPLTFRSVPKCREAVIVTASDKWCSLYETIHNRKVYKPILH